MLIHNAVVERSNPLSSAVQASSARKATDNNLIKSNPLLRNRVGAFSLVPALPNGVCYAVAFEGGLPHGCVKIALSGIVLAH